MIIEQFYFKKQCIIVYAIAILSPCNHTIFSRKVDVIHTVVNHVVSMVGRTDKMATNRLD